MIGERFALRGERGFGGFSVGRDFGFSFGDQFFGCGAGGFEFIGLLVEPLAAGGFLFLIEFAFGVAHGCVESCDFLVSAFEAVGCARAGSGGAGFALGEDFDEWGEEVGFKEEVEERNENDGGSRFEQKFADRVEDFTHAVLF